ncbi:MAG: long-chain fatty acid--CoA ligase [Alphaproteobacteria bacterium]|nr:long-chain fatty acid--CoA ligase [Alphaproteobacteria bacterium]
MLGTLSEIIPRAAARFGNKTALIAGDWRFSFHQVEEQTNRLANALVASGIEPGDRVTLYAPNSWEWLIGYYGVLKTGAVVNPINVMLTPEEVKFVTQDCGAKAILASADKGEGLLDVKADTPLDEVILFGETAPAGARAFQKMLDSGDPEFNPATPEPDEMSTICYTSGTTGHPKGAMLSHTAVLVSTAMTAMMHMRTGEDVVATALPCAHVYGNVVMNACFLYGATFVLIPRFEEILVLDAIQSHRATMFDGVPTAFLYLLAHPDLDNYDLSSLTRCSVGGQTMPIAKAEEFEARFGCPILELWGMTELAGPGTCNPLYGLNKHGSVGIPLPYVECRIADNEDAAKTLPAGEVGELMARGPIVMQGYFNNEQATKETIEPDGWMHTGDLAKQDEDGYVYIVDRKKDMILTAGYNIYPAELERVISGHPAVAMVGVGGLTDEVKGEIAKAYVVLKPGATATEEEVVAYCREHMAAYKVPRAVQFVEDLPKTSTGKIMRRQLKTLENT